MFDKIPMPSVAALPSLLSETVRIRERKYLAKDLPVSALLAAALLDKSSMPDETTLKIRSIMANNPTLLPGKISNMNINDFREFIKEMVSGQRENIASSLKRMVDAGQDEKYQKAMLDWSKFAFGTEQKVDVNVEIEQKRDFLRSISQEYGFSEAIDTEFEDIQTIDKINRKIKAISDHPNNGHTTDFDQYVPEPKAEEPTDEPEEEREDEPMQYQPIKQENL